MPSTTQELLQFIEKEKILIVHFSAPTSPHTFPENFRYYLDGKFTEPLSCSAFRPKHNQVFLGDVGLMLRPTTIESILSVHHQDSGSSNNNGQEQSGGQAPSIETMTASIDNTFDGLYNEWRVHNAEVIGLFVTAKSGIRVRKNATCRAGDQVTETTGEFQIDISEVANCFPQLKIYTYASDFSGYIEISGEVP